MTRPDNLADLWATLTAQAMAFDLPRLRATIHDTADDGLRAANYEGAGGRSADVSSHPERHALNERRDPTRNDLTLVDHHVCRYIAAVYEIATRSHSGPFPNDWRTARIGAKRLDDMAAIEVLETTGQRPARWVHQAGDALHDLELLAGRHLARKANDHERSWTSGLADEQCCRVCLELGLRIERKARGLCQPCLRLKTDLAAELACDIDDAADPPPELLEEFRRINNPGGPAWKAIRSRWISTEVDRRRECA